MTQEEAGKIIGYEYEVKNLKTNKIITNLKRVDDINTSIKVQTDGEYAITVKAIDEAGNRSPAKTVNVYKDETAPEVRNTNSKKYNIKWLYDSNRSKRRNIRNSEI